MRNFDDVAESWDLDPKKIERANAIARAIQHAIPLSKNMSALEYGCGTGLLSFALRPHVGDITLADSSGGMLTVLKRKIEENEFENLSVVQIDLTNDQVPSQRYDLLYTLMVLHHIPDTAHILSRFHTLLNEGGYLCIADLDEEGGLFHGAGFDGHNGFERADLKRKLLDTGFMNVRFTTGYIMDKKINGDTKSFSIFLMTALKQSNDRGIIEEDNG